ncbi:uncharacterized protein [Watersipora subatra]|uniref:uncharacterized protein n=1 Tax=Watersipora subatra TaxID=2589382 RepID=UPI00355C0FAE
MSADFSSHVTRLAEVLERLRQAGLKLKPSKCSLFQTQVKYLGHIVSNTGVATDPEKIQAISGWAAPQDVTQLRSYLGDKHGNADGLSRRQCVDCRQCAAIERRDQGPTRSQVCDSLVTPGTNWETAVPVDQVPVQPPRGTGTSSPNPRQLDEAEWPRLPGNRPVLGRGLPTPIPTSPVPVRLPSGAGTPRVLDHPPRRPQDPQSQAVKITDETKNLDGTGEGVAKKVPEQLTVVQTPLDEVRALQQRATTDLGVIYQAVRDRKGVEEAVLRVGSPELQRLARMFHQLQLDESGVLTLHLTQNGREKRAKTGKGRISGNRQRLYAGRPWQRLAVDLVGPLPPTPRGNSWVMVLTDHFTRWSDALAIPDATAPTELCDLWGVDKSRTTPYHPEGNGVVERNNRVLGDSLRALLLGRGQEDWDQLLPQIMRTLRGSRGMDSDLSKRREDYDSVAPVRCNKDEPQWKSSLLAVPT